MRKYLMITMALGALIALTVAGIATGGKKPVTVRAGNLELTFNGGFTPEGALEDQADADRAQRRGQDRNHRRHPPAGAERIHPRNRQERRDQRQGLSGLHQSGKLQSQDTKHAKAICKIAIIGTGTTNVEIAFPEQTPIPVNSKLIVFNGGIKGGTTTLYIHAYLTVPTPAAIVTTVKIKKIHNGRYGLETDRHDPEDRRRQRLGDVFALKIDKKFTYKGRSQRPHREMPRRQAPGPRHRGLLRRHPRLGRSHPHLHREGLRERLPGTSRTGKD